MRVDGRLLAGVFCVCFANLLLEVVITRLFSATMFYHFTFLAIALALFGAANLSAQRAQRPNIVLMFPDNLGWGEVGAYGGVRGVPTPNIDSLAAQGIRLNNFNVEFSCTVSRAALLTGRYAIRSGATQPTGITQWEVTIADA